MSVLANSAFLNALGWSLLNSIWQFAICWFAYRVFIGGSSKLPAAFKHTAALSLLSAGSIFFIFECTWKFYTGTAPVPGSILVQPGNWYHNWQAADHWLDALMPYWSLVYLVCILLLFVKLVFFVRQAGSLHHRGVTKINGRWRLYIKDISARLGIRRDVKAFLSAYIDTPQVIGFLKPVILIPAACLTHLDTDQVEAVLLHELVHIKRNDYLVNLFMATVEILFFFNPFVKQLTSAIRKEREYSCDDTVIQFQYQPQHYASALLMLEKNRLVPVTYGIAASGKNEKQLLARVERIIGIKNKPGRLYKAGAALVALIFLLLIVFVHPSPVAMSFLDAGPLALAGTTAPGSIEQNVLPATIVTMPTKPAGGETTILRLSAPATALVDPNPEATTGKKKPDRNKTNPNAVAVVFTADENEDGLPDDVIAATSRETRDFSLSQSAMAEAMPAPEPVRAAEPYVPGNSFQFRIVQDSSIPKVKGETYAERQAREALYNTQKALAQLNWQKIEKDLKSQPKLLAKLKKELNLQLQDLNWQRINTEVQDELQQQQLSAVQEVIRQQQTLKEYQQTAVYYEALRRRIAEQEQVIRLSDQQLKETQKMLEDKQKKLTLELKKRRIIYI